jgi:hypothetical protein
MKRKYFIASFQTHQSMSETFEEESKYPEGGCIASSEEPATPKPPLLDRQWTLPDIFPEIHHPSADQYPQQPTLSLDQLNEASAGWTATTYQR